MKEHLYRLYSKRQQDFKSVVTRFPEDDLAGPFLMSPSENYFLQKVPVLIVGQETCGWDYYVDDIEKQMEVYEEFNLGINYRSTPFWNVIRKVEKVLGNKEYSCAWANVSKYDLDGARAFGEHEKVISSLDDILIEEIKIVNPKICIFFTGPSYDYRLQNIFKGIEFKELPNWKSRQFCQLSHPDLPELTFRSYHPKSLRIRKLEDKFINFIESLS